MVTNGITQEFLLFWRHNACLDVLLEGEYPACPFTHRKNRGRYDGRDLTGEPGSIERQLAFDGRVVAGESRIMISGDRTHRSVCAAGAHRPDRFQRFP